MSRLTTNALDLRAPLPAIPGAGDLGIRVTYPTNGPDGYTTALLRLPNDYTLAVVHSPRRQWAVAQRHYVVPGTGVTDPRPLITDPFTGVRMPHGIVWDWNDGRGISSVLRALALLDRAPDSYIGKGKTS
ncbi:hypothetical protein ACIPJN_28780 [Streptomyces sp. NPDC086796]|uniref:hypothetical protein n=1 Tax=Streptomyces sp. NPDC086796 TaxID=3365760 RepID=UPI00381F457B